MWTFYIDFLLSNPTCWHPADLKAPTVGEPEARWSEPQLPTQICTQRGRVSRSWN